MPAWSPHSLWLRPRRLTGEASRRISKPSRLEVEGRHGRELGAVLVEDDGVDDRILGRGFVEVDADVHSLRAG